MQKLSLLVAASVIGLGSAYSAMAQAPLGKPGAKATIQAPALVSAKGSLGSLARETPTAQARSAKANMGALATSAVAASSAKANVSSLATAALASVSAGKANMSAAANRSSSSAAAKANLNPAANGAAVKANSNFGSMARLTSASKVSGVTTRASMSALAQAAPAAAGMVNRSNFNAYAK